MIDGVCSPRGLACDRSVFRGRPGCRGLAAGSVREPAAKHLHADGQARAGAGLVTQRLGSPRRFAARVQPGRALHRPVRAGCGGSAGRACARPRGRRGCGRSDGRPGGSKRSRASRGANARLVDERSFNPMASPLARSEGQFPARGAQPYLGARTRIVRRQDDRWGVIPRVLFAAARSLEAVQAVEAWRQAPCGSRPQSICVTMG